MTDGAPGDIDVAKYERKRSIGPLVFALGTPDRDAAAAALARLRDPRSVKRIVDKVSTAPGDAAMSHAATVALHGLGDEALEPLIELASDHSLLSPERDELAFIMLGRLHTPAARDWLLAASRNEHHKVRWNALTGSASWATAASTRDSRKPRGAMSTTASAWRRSARWAASRPLSPTTS